MKRRKQSEDETQVSSAVVKFTTICQNSSLVRKINKIVFDLNKITSEAYHLANFHVLRCIEGGQELAPITQMFFYTEVSNFA